MTFDAGRFLEASGAEFRRVRLERGLSREHVAELAEIHPNTVGVAERGDRDQSSIKQTRLLLALGCERLFVTPAGIVAVLSDDPCGDTQLRAIRDPVFAQHIGEAIRRRRRAMGMSLDAVALRAAVHRNTLWNIERGLVLPSSLNLYRVYLSLGVRTLIPSREGLELD